MNGVSQASCAPTARRTDDEQQRAGAGALRRRGGEPGPSRQHHDGAAAARIATPRRSTCRRVPGARGEADDASSGGRGGEHDERKRPEQVEGIGFRRGRCTPARALAPSGARQPARYEAEHHHERGQRVPEGQDRVDLRRRGILAEAERESSQRPAASSRGRRVQATAITSVASHSAGNGPVAGQERAAQRRQDQDADPASGSRRRSRARRASQTVMAMTTTV